ncbi:hypothetical protein THMIRHAT_14050 [Thiosulfativibrio zosterae]|uniref:Big-1 domain-containing protein n=2 Tax=Thiosulfativibrio zosterae TaxID=2675053 RepID=A0A6F8PNH0_9GAMM|nr:hypothetical protein THMIRHAT_14050 [Thiosulfativibrio zosterae]
MIYIFFTLFLSACGGETSSQITTAGLNLTSFTLASNGISTTTIPSNDTAVIKIKLLDSYKRPIIGAIITVSTNLGTVSQPRLTDTNGETSFNVSPPSDLSTSASVGTITMTYDTYTTTQNFEVISTSTTGTSSSSVSSIQFISAAPTQLSLKGTGGIGLAEQAKVTFKLVDTSGFAVEGATLNFKISTSVGNLSLTNSSAITNSDGEAFTYVLSGTVPTSVRVTAFTTDLNGNTISIQSDILGIATSIPDQNSFEITLETLAPQGWSYSGEEVLVTARAADRNNNPVPNGTAVYFTAEGGSIEPACQTDNGVCSVTWRSQAPRPVDHRVTIMAYTIGTETFYDREGGEDGVFDNVDIFDDLPEAFRDDDENGVYNPIATSGFVNDLARDERYVDYDSSNTYTSADGKYNGFPCNHPTDCPTDANNLAGRSNLLTHVRDSKVLILADNHPNIEIYETNGTVNTCLTAAGKIDTVNCLNAKNTIQPFAVGTSNQFFWVLIEDTAAKCQTSATNLTRIDTIDPNAAACLYAVRQSAPTGSSLSVSSEVGTLSGVPESTIANSRRHREFLVTVTSAPDNDTVISGNFEVSIISPKGEVTSASVTLSDPIN